MTTPPKPVPAPPMADPLNGAKLPARLTDVVAVGTWTTARASSAR
jgi:hypothetical protein